MKSIEIKILVTLIVITLSACSSINRKRATKAVAETKVVVTTKSDGSGSWNEGFIAPFIEIIQGDQTNPTGRYSFKPNTFTEDLGWVFEWNGATIPTNFDKFTKTDSNGRLYVPWRYWNSWGVEKKSSSYKMLVGNVVNDAGDNARIRFNMPWAFWTSYISDTEMNQLLDIVSTGSVRQTNKIASAKKSILSNYKKLTNAKFAIDNSNNEINALKATLQKRIGENNILLSQRKASLDAVKKSLEGSQQQLLLLNASLAGVKQQVAIMNSESDNALLMTNDALRKSILSDVGKEIISQKENITSQFGKLGDLAKTVTFAPIMAPALLGNTEKLILEFLGVSNI
jgi:regulator of replication initiation timing